MRNLFILLILSCLSPQLHSKVKSVKEATTLLSQSPEGLVHLFEGSEMPILFVHGIDFDVGEWIRPLEISLKNKRNTYFYKFSKFDSLVASRDDMREAVINILEEHPQEELLIVAHSMGGIISLLTLDTFIRGQYEDRIKIHTIASPGFGFEAPPKMAYVLAPFIGLGTVQMGIGGYKKIRNDFLDQCHHWITTNCALDKHACNRRTLNPQTGSLNGSEKLPCGIKNVTYLDDETHATVISRVVEELMGQRD
jgi:hypothetical protein